MLLQCWALGVTMSWDEGFLGARASRPHQAWHSLGHLPHLDQPGTAPWLSFGLADAVPAHRVAACSIALKLSGGQRDRMRAGRPRSQGNHSPLEGESQKPSRQAKADAVGGVWRSTSQKADVRPLGNSRLPASPAPAPHDGADHSRVKQPVLIPIGSRGHVSLIRLAASLNIDTQDRQDKQDEKLVHKKLIGSIIECAFVENLSVLRGPSRIPFESFPTPWNPFADSSFALLTDPLSPLVEIFSPFPTFGGSLLSFLQPLSGPSSSFVALRGFLFLAFVDNPQLFQASGAFREQASA